MKQIELTADLALEQVIQQAQQQDIVLTRQGHAVALISEIDDEDLYWRVREYDPEFLASLVRARAQVAQGQVVSHEDLKRQLGIH
jgi:PHD/YefM family antitoxin component YafN of YafNO toxin-antitoxin module